MDGGGSAGFCRNANLAECSIRGMADMPVSCGISAPTAGQRCRRWSDVMHYSARRRAGAAADAAARKRTYLRDLPALL